MRDINNKERFLKIIDIFDKETDENHELSIRDLKNKLIRDFGNEFNVSERSLKNDIKILEICKYDLIVNQDKHGKKLYSKQNRKFSNHQLRILIDAVNSSRFLQINEKKKIINNIKSLTSNYLASRLQNNIYMDTTKVSIDTSIKYIIDKLHNSVQNNKVIIFQYGKFNMDKNFELNHEGKYYKAEPYGLVWHNEFYYLVAKDLKKDKIVNFRVDRMRNVEVGNSFNSNFFDLDSHIHSSFNMYPGDLHHIEIKFHKSLVNAIIDKFGIDGNRGTIIRKINGDYFSLRTRAAINEGLVRWILMWGSDAEVIKPIQLKEKIQEEILKMIEIYFQ
ncbi:MAG: helix-turn-helix transcriptional regulator [Senegalia sp. (in: firmicutes)]|uniref:helix-turn-helix transcriptional regulator n=1 Tax=Senegalia sp. (in: firmicutes) TaxID=1924098 RepID=UPI003F9ACBA1